MKYLKVYLAGLLTLITVSAIGFTKPGTYGYRSTGAYTTTTNLVCIDSAEVKEQLKDYQSIWIGINRNPRTGDVYSFVELYTQEDKWMIFEHYVREKVSCNLGIGEEWVIRSNSTSI